MKLSYESIQEIFFKNFTRFHAHVATCECGREHVCIDSHCFDDEEDLRNRYKQHRHNKVEDIVFHDGCDYVGILEINNRHYVVDCDCEGWKPFLSILVMERHNIRQFLVDYSEQIKIALEEEKVFNILKHVNI